MQKLDALNHPISADDNGIGVRASTCGATLQMPAGFTVFVSCTISVRSVLLAATRSPSELKMTLLPGRVPVWALHFHIRRWCG